METKQKRVLEIADIQMYGQALKFKYRFQIKDWIYQLESIEVSIEDSDYIKVKFLNNFGQMRYINIKDCIPILRPLSDINEVITHKQEDFNTINELKRYGEIVGLWCEMSDIIIEDCKSAPYWIIQKLIEWKFDINNLIGQGLAISVHDVEGVVYE